MNYLSIYACCNIIFYFFSTFRFNFVIANIWHEGIYHSYILFRFRTSDANFTQACMVSAILHIIIIIQFKWPDFEFGTPPTILILGP